ncbi:hypothetical protein ACQ4PT_039899 [Festuca glaucescens]
MQLRYLPFAASAVAGRSFLAARPVTGRNMQLCHNADNSSPPPEKEDRAEEALRRLAELDAQLEGLKEPKMRPPPPPPPPGNQSFPFPTPFSSCQVAAPVFHVSIRPCPTQVVQNS